MNAPVTSIFGKKVFEPVEKEQVAIIGFNDALAGQVVHMLSAHTHYEPELFISVADLHELDIEKEHAKRPNRKTEFEKNGRIFGKTLHVGANYIEAITDRNISKCFVLDDDKYLRSEVFVELREHNVEILSFIDPSVYLGGHNSIGTGAIIFPNCYIGYKSDVGDGVIIQSGTTIEHHNAVGDFTNINPNLTTGGFTKIEEFCEINISVDIINKITIGRNTRIGAGSLVLENCREQSVYYGRPAKLIRESMSTTSSTLV